jgi:zinc ribbon protein
MAAQQAQLTPKKKLLGVGGLAAFGSGGCLMLTVVLVPLALPLAVIGALMAVGSLFVKTEPLKCPACGAMSEVERQVRAATCPHCDQPIKRDGDTWIQSE